MPLIAMQLMCFHHLSFLQFHLPQLSRKVLVEGLGERESPIWMELSVIFHGGVWTVLLTIDIQRRIQSKCSIQSPNFSSDDIVPLIYDIS